MTTELGKQLSAVAAVLRDVLGEEALGAYVYGSSAKGPIRPTSDVDIFVVLRRRTRVDLKRRLADRLTRISARRIRPQG